MENNEELTPEEKDELSSLLGYGSNIPESKSSVHTFLMNVAKAKDTTKLGFLTGEELGSLTSPVRAHKFMQTFATDIMNIPGLGEFFGKQSEMATATSLSREGFLIKQATVSTTVKKVADVTPEKKKNKSWFKSKDEKKVGAEI